QTLIMRANTQSAAALQEVNQKLEPENQIRTFLQYPGYWLKIRSEYKRLYPEGRRFSVSDRLGAMAFACLIAAFVLMSIAGWGSSR
ncbi:MAG: hypothetical protein WCI21_04335, partial [Alphaproteobacteria bacterium]